MPCLPLRGEVDVAFATDGGVVNYLIYLSYFR